MDWKKLTDADTLAQALDEMERRFRGAHMIARSKNGNEYVVTYRHGIKDGWVFDSTKYGQIVIGHNSEMEIIPKFPEAGVYHIGDENFVYFTRNPARQWHRAVTQANTHVLALFGNAVAGIDAFLYEKLCYPELYKNVTEEQLKQFPQVLRDGTRVLNGDKPNRRAIIQFDHHWMLRGGGMYFNDTLVAEVGRTGKDTASWYVSNLLQQEFSDRFLDKFNWTITK